MRKNKGAIMLVKKTNKADSYNPWEFAVNFGLNNFLVNDLLSGKEVEVSEEIGKGLLKESVVEKVGKKKEKIDE